MLIAPRMIRFLLVGGSTAAAQLSLTWLFVDVILMHVLVGSTVAAALAAAYNYTLHYHWTFSAEAPHGWTLFKYLLVCLGALLVNGVVMYLGVTVYGAYYLAVQIVAGVSVVIWSFCLSSFWVFAE